MFEDLLFSDELAITRPSVPAADAILGKPIHVLDGLAFVRLIDYMGNDDAIVQAARVSYGDGTREVSEDAGLIRYLLKHRHTSPFEQVELKFHIRAPILVARQQLRTRTAMVNEESARYSEMSEDIYAPDLKRLKAQSQDNKQGSGELLPYEDRVRASEIIADAFDACESAYRQLLNLGLAREVARIVKPVANYTEYYFKINLHNLFHFLGLRLDAHAQWEIQQIAGAMAAMAERVAPVAFEAFVEYQLNARTFSATELTILRRIVAESRYDRRRELAPLSKRERREFLEKIGG